MKIILAVLFFVTSAAIAQQSDQVQQFESGEQQVPLIELFTSEGCSSCPPADRWLSGLRDDEQLWSGFVPVAFHVDYWDYIGWKDPYASREYSQRQRRYAAEYSESTVYTPGMRKNGEEWRSWRFLGKPEDKSATDVGKITLTVSDAGSFDAAFLGQGAKVLNVALLGVDIENDVTRGENSGKTLKHDFVVLGISRFSSAEQGKWSGELPKPSVEAERYAIAAWVTNGASQVPIQATGGYLAGGL